jgi:hypothetical protein
MAKQKDNYTKPELRERLKKKIMKGTKGGRAGQWSARKAQLLASEYKEKGGGYSGEKKTKQKHLDQWTKEKWTTADGKKAKRKTKKGKTVTARYLPKKAWSKLSKDEKQATDTKKRKASRKGKQFVGNTSAAKKARKTTVRRAKK